ncbi:MAG: CBS domain-containing protein [Myxococcota bacterium]
MNVKVDELMVPQVITTQPHVTVGHVKGIMRNAKVNVIPVVGPEGEAVGIVSSSDLLDDLSDAKPVSSVMTEKVYTIPQYEEVSVAARVMRNHRIHHLVVTHEQKVTGILSTFDLIKLIEGKRFVMKNAGSPSSRKQSKRE